MTHLPQTKQSSIVGPILTGGFGAAIAGWITTWFFHLPGLQTSPGPLLAVLGLVMLTVTAVTAAHCGNRALIAGPLIAVTTALINLLALGTVLAQPPEPGQEMTEVANTFREDAVLVALAYFVGSIALGVLGGTLGMVSSKNSTASSIDEEPQRWLGRFAVLGAIAFVPLLGIGGAVTSTDSGLAVPEGFNAYGSLPFLLPISVMAGEPRIFFEHSHRLFGMLVGVTMIVLLVRTFMVDQRSLARKWSIGVLVAVIVQGLLGAWRVADGTGTADAAIENAESTFATDAEGASRMHQVLALLHGVSGQLVFCSGVALAVILQVGFRAPETSFPDATARAARVGRAVIGVTAALTLFQLLTGAATRHLGDAHAGWTHVGFSLIVAGFVAASAMLLWSADRYSKAGRTLRTFGFWLLAIVGLQFLLGFGTLGVEGIGGGGRNIPSAQELSQAEPIELWRSVIPTLHQTLGAALIALLTASFAWCSRFTTPKPTSAAQQPLRLAAD